MKKNLFLFCLITSATINAQNYAVEQIDATEYLSGDLYVAGPRETVVLLIAGSGPTNRNGNSVGIAVNNSLKFLAQGLAKNNYNVFTYDKRVVYLLNNKKEIPNLDFQHGIDDATTLIHFLKEKLHFKNVVVAGHSEGSLIGMIAAQKNAAAFISLAGAGNTIDVILKEQLNKQVPMLNNEVDRILTELKNGQKVNDVNPLLKSLFAEQNQPFLMEWMQLNPAEEIAKLKMPILIINGTNDIQVSEEEASILHEANKKSEIVIIKGMNHIFKTVSTNAENMKSYTDPNLPINEELVTVITKFLQKNKL